MSQVILRAFAAAGGLFIATSAAADAPRRAPSTTFGPADVFGLEWASAPAIAPDGARVAYVRVSGDIM